VYKELRRMAAGYLRRERGGHTLQPTALVHAAYLQLIDQKIADCHTRAQFFAIAANLMRQILVDHAKRHRSLKRGGGNKVALEEAAGAVQPQLQVDLVALNEALEKLAQLNQRQSRVVELRFFGGLNEEDCWKSGPLVGSRAEAPSSSPKTSRTRATRICSLS
jgi:RNA polymerase sigma-70 factor, ECF subfamily